MKLINPLPCIKLMVENRFLLGQLVHRNFEARFKGSYLGLIWSFVQPLMMLSVYTFVFTYVLKAKFGVPIEDTRPGAFPMIMFCGMAVFNIFSDTVNSCSTIVNTNSNLVKKVVFPLELLPMSQALVCFIFGLIWFFLLMFGVIFILNSLRWTALLVPLMLVPLFLFSAGCGFIVSAFGVYIRDLPYMIGVVLQILFFMTPIFYSVKSVPPQFQVFLYLNPLCEMVEQTRVVFLYGQFPNWSYVVILWLGSILVFHFGFLLFSKLKKGFADVL
ncbi:MAG: ABC transporter permease [Lentisphaeria bacterium]|nr:ABC transporter permease [Lentisphaeria bacterium]